MNALNFEISDEAVALHYNMHETGDKVVRYFAANRHHSNLSASYEIHSIPE